jgi:LPXTG-site transpeptidase (sortase) family protein
MLFVSPLEYRAAQATEFNALRNELAHGLAPIGPIDQKHRVLAPGSPVAELRIPRLHLSAVVVEGTSGEALTRGPGHLRSTVLPGEAGTSVVYGRAAAYGGPFRGLHRLRPGDTVVVTSGVGTETYTVVDVRRSGDPVPAMPASGARLTLVTATGLPFLPAGVLRADADLKGTAPGAVAPLLSTVPRSELPLGTDTSTLWELAFILQALILTSVGAVFAWRRWGRPQAWIVFAPLAALLGYFAVDQLVRLLPNLT